MPETINVAFLRETREFAQIIGPAELAARKGTSKHFGSGQPRALIAAHDCNKLAIETRTNVFVDACVLPSPLLPQSLGTILVLQQAAH